MVGMTGLSHAIKTTKPEHGEALVFYLSCVVASRVIPPIA
jgi:hypothetical protein